MSVPPDTGPAASRVITWNLERKKPTAPTGAEALDLVFSMAADVLVLTEARTTMDPRGGHLLPAPVAPVGSRFADDERKVVVWSRRPWRDVDVIELGNIDRSRIITASTDTPIGRLTVLGLCIPWPMAEVSRPSGPKRAPWELHHAFLEGLGPILARARAPFVVAGDFNQRIPRSKGANRAAAEALAEVFGDLTIVTAGLLDGCERPGIDHIACSGLRAERTWGWRNDATGRRLSDHDGAGADLVPGPESGSMG